MENKWVDCFDRELHDGDDVIVAFIKNGDVRMRSGLVIKLKTDIIEISCNDWEDGKENEQTITMAIPCAQKLNYVYKL